MRMRKSFIVGIIIIFIGFLGWFFFGRISLSTDSATRVVEGLENETPLQENTTPELSGVGTIVDLLKLGKSLSCTYTQDSEKSGKSAGVIYLDGIERIRVDAQTEKDGKQYDSHIVYTSTDMYLWVESAEKSFALKVPVKNPVTTYSTTSPELNTQTMYEDVTYICTSWNLDEGVFTPPSDIEFVDPTTMIQDMFKGLIKPK